MTKEEAVNAIIKECGVDTNKISDGYHTFNDLYEHRIVLFIQLCFAMYSWMPNPPLIWRSKAHSDDSVWDGWFIMGIDAKEGWQITYHLPMRLWPATFFCNTLDKAPEFDGHTSSDVLKRLQILWATYS